MPAGRTFGGIDWIVLVVYAAVVLGIGFHFARRQRTTEEYFTGGRHMNPLLAGISVFAAFFSIISYTATPGEYVQYGPTLVILAPLVALPFYYYIVGWLMVPVIMRLPITSAFELLESRLGRSVRQAGSFTYVVTRIVWMAMILYTASTVFVHVLDCDPRWAYVIALVIGSVTTTYTLVGGIRTVMVTEAVQSSMLMLGAVLTVVFITWNLGGVGAWLPHRWEPHWPRQPFFSTDLHVRITLLPALAVSIIGGIVRILTDQSAVQRLLTTQDVTAARKAYMHSNYAILLASFLLCLVGAAVLAFYRVHPEALPAHLTVTRNGDAIFPYFISHNLPHGLSGLIVASLMAAAMSCLAGGLNSTTTVIIKDFIEIWWGGHKSEAAKMRTTRGLVLILGVGAIALSALMGSVSGNLNEVASKTIDLLGCPMFGLFFLAIFVSYSTAFGALMGAIYSTASAVVVGYWDALTGQPKISFLWVAIVPFFVSLAAGCLFSLVPTRGRPGRVVVGYTVLFLLPLAAFFVWLIAHYR